MNQDPYEAILVEGESYWRRTRANRVAFLVDGERYFGAVADALENARESVFLIGWDFHSEVRLRRNGESGPSEGGRPDDLVGLLDALARERKELHAYVLAWDFAMLYAFDREFLPLLQFGQRTHRRIHFAMDAAHPTTASQHQKIVVIDDAVAFVGGFDLTSHRWDTREHRADDPRRTTPKGKRYAPFHDVQVAIDGEAARAIGDLARDRWLRATGRSVPEVTDPEAVWPERLVPDVEDVPVAIARTRAAYGDQEEVREIEALYERSLKTVERTLYIENQYLTSPDVTTWLAERLQEPDGPEILIVGPRSNSGWLEEHTMGALRDLAIRRLRDADAHDRLRILYPHAPDLRSGEIINVHSKVMVLDEEVLRIGSSNLSNRSLGLDTECDLAFFAEGREDLRRGFARLRDDLLAEHLGTDVETFARLRQETGSLIAAVDALRKEDGRTLRPIELDASDEAARAVRALGAFDPEHPMPLEELIRRFDSVQDDAAAARKHQRWGALGLLGALAATGLVWQIAPLEAWSTAEHWTDMLRTLGQSPSGQLAGVAVLVVGSLLMVPVTVLSLAAGLAFGPVNGAWIAWLGSVASAAFAYGIGRLLWRDSVRRLAGKRLNTLSRRLARRGVLSSALLGLLPVAPFTVANLVAGASHVRARDFLFGIGIGILPWSITMPLFGDALARLAVRWEVPAWAWGALVVLLIAISVGVFRRVSAPIRRAGRRAGVLSRPG